MMDHEKVQAGLPDLAAGTLGCEPAARMQEHVATCGECSSWLATYRLLTDCYELPGQRDEHPTAEDLASHAVFGGGPEGSTVFHLAGCPECREAIELGCAALSEPDGEAPLAASRPRIGWKQALAAAAIVMVALPAVWLGILQLADRETGHELLDGLLLEEHMTVVAEKSLTAIRTEVAAGAVVTLRAGDSVVLGDGFSIEEGAIVTIEVGGQAGEDTIHSE